MYNLSPSDSQNFLVQGSKRLDYATLDVMHMCKTVKGVRCWVYPNSVRLVLPCPLRSSLCFHENLCWQPTPADTTLLITLIYLHHLYPSLVPCWVLHYPAAGPLIHLISRVFNPLLMQFRPSMLVKVHNCHPLMIPLRPCLLIKLPCNLLTMICPLLLHPCMIGAIPIPVMVLILLFPSVPFIKDNGLF